MSHLSRSEIVDLVEGTLAPGRAAHLDACAACRDEVETIRTSLRDAMAVDVPDPSPLFWEHFRARVREGVERAPRRSAWKWIDVRAFAPVPVVLVAFLVVGLAISGGVMRGRRPIVSERSAPAVVASTPGLAAIDLQDQGSAVLDAGDAEVWAVLTAAAADVRMEDAHAAGMQVYPATVDRAVQSLSPSELNELGRLLQTELKRSMD